jgi:hypothetical protein
MKTVILAGRRPDPEGADIARFPITNAIAVRERIRELMVNQKPDALVCSAACGADLLALDVAGELGVERHVVLPFEAAAFRASSVTDRPGGWGPLFDRVVREVEASGGLTVMDEDPSNDDAYAAANDRMLALAGDGKASVVAVAVWEGSSRGDGDLTAHMIESASRAGADVAEVMTR